MNGLSGVTDGNYISLRLRGLITGLIKYFRIHNQYLGFKELAYEGTMHSTTLEQRRHSSGKEMFFGN